MEIDIEKETVRLRESFLKQIMAISSVGLAILIGLFEKFTIAGVDALWYYSATAFWLIAICLALYSQSKLSWYFSKKAGSMYTLKSIINTNKEVTEKLNSIDEKTFESDIEKIDSIIEESNVKLAKTREELDDVISRSSEFKKTDIIIVSFSYVGLVCFSLGVLCISIGLYQTIS